MSELSIRIYFEHTVEAGGCSSFAIFHVGEGERDGDGGFCFGVCLDVAMCILAKKCETPLNSSSMQEALLCLTTVQTVGKGEIALQTPLLPLP